MPNTRLAAAGAAVFAIILIIAAVFVLGRDGDSDESAIAAGDTSAGDTSDSLGEKGGTPGVLTGEDGSPTAAHAVAVVSNHELATQAGIEVLAQGGTAADAAIAVASVLSVVEPWFSTVLGGGTWALYYDAQTGRVSSLDGVGPTGSLATPEDYEARAGDHGMHQANTPGAWDGWMLWLERYGALDLGDVLDPAIRIAREGYPVSPPMASWLGRSQENVLAFPDSAAIYAPDGEVLDEGDIVHQHDMAATLAALVAAYDGAREDGRSAAVRAARDYFYRGPIADAIVAFSDANDGYLTIEDFHGFEAQILDAISIDYSDELTVYQNPPNSQGITQLLALNILKGYDFGSLPGGEADAVHLQVEALKLAFADRYYHVGDPARVDVPVTALLSDEYAAAQRERLNTGAVLEWPIPDGLELAGSLMSDASHTSSFHIVDQWGNAAAVTTSLGAQFLVIGDTGIHINNRMRFYSVEEGNPNLLTQGYKVRHTSNPYMVLRNGRPYILGGNTGADTQVQGQLQQFIHVVEFGRRAQETIDAPRFVTTSFPATTYPWQAANELRLEDDFDPAIVADLEARGHDVAVGAGTYGSANMLIISPDGLDVDVGAESRGDTAYGIVIRPTP